MLAVFYLLLKSSFYAFLLVFLHFITKNFIIGFKDGEACKPKPMFINSIENKKLRRDLPKSKEPVKLVEPEIDVEQYYEEQLRIESKPKLKIYYGE
jgi:hypothetical protein